MKNENKQKMAHLLEHLIREDNVIEFIKYITPIDITFNSLISHSIFETNSFLEYIVLI